MTEELSALQAVLDDPDQSIENKEKAAGLILQMQQPPESPDDIASDDPLLLKFMNDYRNLNDEYGVTMPPLATAAAKEQIFMCHCLKITSDGQIPIADRLEAARKVLAIRNQDQTDKQANTWTEDSLANAYTSASFSIEDFASIRLFYMVMNYISREKTIGGINSLVSQQKASSER